MFNKTTSAQITKYYQIFNELTDDTISTLNVTTKNIRHQNINRFFQFDKPTYIKCTKGIVMMALANEDNPDQIDFYVVHRVVKINKRVLYNFVSLTKSSTLVIYSEPGTKRNIIHLDKEIKIPKIIPTFSINQVYAYYLQVKGSAYFFSGEKHNYWELTYVDTGQLKTTINGITHELNDKDLIIYGPNQFHNQFIDNDRVCSYLTVMFEMNPEHYSTIVNRKFHVNRHLHPIMQKIMKATTNETLLGEQLLLVYLKELILELYQYDYVDAQMITTPAQQRFEDEMLNEIIVFINENLSEPLTVEAICQKYAISRSTLQALFKKNMNVGPKHFINERKLAQSKLLIKENKYTLSEVSEMLSYTSIHYFSRTFKKRFGITPSEYAKSIYK